MEKRSRFLDDCSLSSSSVSSVGSQRVRFFIEGVSYRAFRRPAVTTTGAVFGLIKAGQRQPRGGRGGKTGEGNWKKKEQEKKETQKNTEKNPVHRAKTEHKERQTQAGNPGDTKNKHRRRKKKTERGNRQERERERPRTGGRDQEKSRASQHRKQGSKTQKKNKEETRGTSKHRQNKKRRTNSQNNKNEEGRRRKALSRPGQ
jgi:hypothetical protein